MCCVPASDTEIETKTLQLYCLFYVCSALRVRQKMCGKGRPILMIGDLLCENVSILCES